jgi:uncharacterized protein YheU (UPF0270 family)
MSDELPNGEVTLVPYTAISKEAVEVLVSEFILREGTDYGEHEMTFDEKSAQLHHRLKMGEAHISFCHDSNTCNLTAPNLLGHK